MKKFNIVVDLTLSGDFEIEAETEKEAREKIMQKYFDNYMKSGMHELSREIYEVEEII